MADTAVLGWEVCAEVDSDGLRCGGVRLAAGDRCLAHAAEQDVVVELKRLSDGGVLDARGVPITSRLLDRLLDAVPRNDNNRPVLNAASFDGASFQSGAAFHWGDLPRRGQVWRGDLPALGRVLRSDLPPRGRVQQGGLPPRGRVR